MRYLGLKEVLELHRHIIEQSGSAAGVRDLGLIESALAQPLMTFGSRDLYPTLTDKASALGFSLIKNHPFLNGNKRIGHAALETFLVLNGYEIDAPVDEQERVILKVAVGELGRSEFTEWLRARGRAGCLRQIEPPPAWHTFLPATIIQRPANPRFLRLHHRVELIHTGRAPRVR